MKKISVSVSYDEEKLSTIKLYLEPKGIHVEDEIINLLDTLYAKNVYAPATQNLPPRRYGGKKRSRNLPRR